jgi:hypothetical protein
MSVAAVEDRLKRTVAQAKASAANACLRRLMDSQIGLVHESTARIANSAGLCTGSGFSARLLRIENSAVTPPIPSASDTTAKAVTTGVARSDRHASRQSTVNTPRVVIPAARSAEPNRTASTIVAIQNAATASAPRARAASRSVRHA